MMKAIGVIGVVAMLSCGTAYALDQESGAASHDPHNDHPL